MVDDVLGILLELMVLRMDVMEKDVTCLVNMSENDAIMHRWRKDCIDNMVLVRFRG